MIKILKENDYFRTNDLNLAVTLCCYGYKIEALDKNNPDRVIFLIPRNAQLDDLIQQFWIQQLQVEPIAYFSLLKQTKSRLYQ